VAIWADCFVTYNEPHIGQAAASVLEALGYAVELPVAGCCGRPLISTGQLEQAIRVADKSLRAMHRTIHDPGVVAIIVLEPSCLSAMKDEWLKLKLSTDLATRQRLAAKAVSIEEFVEQRWEQHPAKPERADAAAFGNQQLVLHGHCHQKALWGTGATVAALRRTCGNRVTVLDSGCCGMAGSFGYTADRYELSMKIGELSVFPPIRAAGENAVIVAPGTSCRHQIRDGTGRESLHPAEAMARGLCVSQ
jgi:Fe-S oxidoreductase